jgi:hypothetical protein
MQLAWSLALEILESGKAGPPGHGRLAEIGRIVAAKLERDGIVRDPETLEKTLRQDIRAWERDNPGE